MLDLLSLDQLAARIPDGARIAIPKDDTGAPLAATLALMRRGVRGLHLVCVPVAGIAADLLIGAGHVTVVETSAVTLGEHGAAPRFSAAVRAGSVRIIDATCPAIYAGLQASQKGIPFMPLRGIVGSDLMTHRRDWAVIDNPFADGDRLVAIQAIQPDVALFHALAADRHGNVLVGRDRDGLLLAHASRRTLVTVEEVVGGDLMDDPLAAAGVVPALYVEAVALAPQGCRPLGFLDRYGADDAWLARYARLARDESGFRACLGELQSAPFVAA
ncbi:MAG: CoA transferase subunit A [Aquabacterium sp.]